MKVGQLCEWKTVQVRGLKGVWEAKGWVRGSWAAIRQPSEPSLWSLVLLPLGLSLPLEWASFPSAGKAVGAMVKIVSMRNDWPVIQQADLTKTVGERLKTICQNHGALDGGKMTMALGADEGIFGQPVERLNGFPSVMPQLLRVG